MFSLRILSLAAFVLTLSSCGSYDRQDSLSSQQQIPGAVPTQTVDIPANAAGKGPAAYGANPLTITEGTSLIWMNTDSMAHTSTSDTGVWDTGAIQPGAMSSPVPFNSPGVFPYHCSIHGAASMSGTIEVTAASPSPSPSSSVSPSPSPTVSITPTPTPTMTTVPASPKKK
jgi:plastocyanin